MDTTAYLERIGYHGSAQPTLANLRAMHRAHLLAVPFENLDIHLRREISLDPEALFDKIVRRRRGGFCYELNSLFADLLTGLGYGVTLLSAESANDDGSFSLPFDHLALQVQIPGEAGSWLADVGWGNGFLEPLRLHDPDEQAQGERAFKITPQEGYQALTERGAEGIGGEKPEEYAHHWVRHYRFNFQPHELAEFAPMCRYHQTSPESIFTRKRMVTRFTPEGRVTLSDLRLIITRGGQREERALSGEEEARAVLRDLFGMQGEI